MISGLVKLCAMVSSVVMVAGCGGSSGGGSSGGGTATTVTFTFNGPAPTAVAAKTGSGNFAAQTLKAGVLSLSLPTRTTSFAVAFACPAQSLATSGIQLGQLTQQTVFEATTADGTNFSLNCGSAPSSFQSGLLTGSVDATAVPSFAYTQVAIQGKDSFALTGLLPVKSIFSIPAQTGSDRVEVLAYSSGLPILSPALSFGGMLLAAKNFDQQTVPGPLNGGTQVVFTAADQTTTMPITYKNVPQGFAPPFTNVTFSMGGTGVFGIAQAAGDSYPVLPSTAVEPGDSYTFLATVHSLQIGNLGVGPYVLASATSSSAGPMTFTFPAPWISTGPTPAALPSFNFDYAGFSGTSGVTNVATLLWKTGNTVLDQNASSLIATPGFLKSTGQATFPDLSAITGFIPAPPSRTPVFWTAEVLQDANGVLIGANSGKAIVGVANSGRFTVP